MSFPALARHLVASTFALGMVMPHSLAAQAMPRDAVDMAVRAVESGRPGSVAAQWRSRVASNPSDRVAILGLATLARLTYRFDDALRLYRRVANRGPEDSVGVWALLGEAMVLEAQGDRRGIALYRQAREMARRNGSREGEGVALLELAFAELGPKGTSLLLARLDTVRRLLPRDARAQHVRRLRYMAVAMVVSGAPSAADTTRTAITAAQRARDLREEAAAQRTLGLHFSLRGAGDSALARYAIAESLFARSGDRRGLAYTLMFRGDYLWSRGLLGPAKAAIERALPEAEASGYADGMGHVHVGLASVASRVGDYPLALRHAARAIARYDSLGDTYSSNLTHALKAQIHLMAGDADGARRETPWLLEVIRTSPEVNQRVEGQQVLVSAALLTGAVHEAERLLTTAERHARESGMESWVPRIALARARVALARGQMAPARAALARALGSMDTTQHIMRYEARVALAEVAVRERNIAAAAAAMDSAAAELDRWRAGLSSVELRMLAFQSLTPDAGDQTPGVARVLNALATHGHAARAFALAERRRARELSDRMARRTALFTRGSGTDAVSAPWSGPAVATAAGVAAALPDSTALLEYVVASGGAPTTVFVITRAGTRAHTIVPEDTVRRDVARFTGLLEAGTVPTRLADSLGEHLMAPALRHLPASITRLIIVPDGVLHRVPFDALRTGGRFVVERYAVSIAPSATVALALERRRSHAGGAVRLVAFADPAIDVAGERAGVTAPRVAQFAAFARTGGLPRLPGAAEEARLVARYASTADVFLGARATASRLRERNVSEADILHLATHALIDESSMTGTALALAGDDRSPGFVTPGDLASLQLAADLVVLSACRSAGGALVGGEGILGLTSPLLQAGARSIVATRWRVADRRTVPFIRDFYDALAARQPVAEALRAAKLASIARGDPPREWAAFQAIGDPMVVVPLRKPATFSPAWLAAGLAAAAAGAAGVLLRRRRYSRMRAIRASERRSLPSSTSARTDQ